MSEPNRQADSGRHSSKTTPGGATPLSSMVGDTVSSATATVKQQASEIGSNVAEELGTAADAQKVRGADLMQAVAQAITTASRELETSSPASAKLAKEFASNVNKLSNSIRGRDLKSIWDDASEVARSQPALFFGAAVLSGFAISRFLVSSRARNEGTTGSVGEERAGGRNERSSAQSESASSRET